MQANETKLQDLFEGTKQYVIPLFQRTYSWTNKEWETLWKDLIELCGAENPRTQGPTNRLERFNNTLRQRLGRFARKTLSFSKVWTYVPKARANR